MRPGTRNAPGLISIEVFGPKWLELVNTALTF